MYHDSAIYGRGVWNEATKDFDYTFKTLAFPCRDDSSAADCKIAASPDGNTVWVSVLTNPDGTTPLIDSTYFPVLRKSTDGGLNWSDQIVIQLDGPNGIQAVLNQYSEYFIMNFFTGPPWPWRDEIPYTTAFDHSLSVDKWGNLHIGVAIGYAPGGYAISTGIDSLINVFDIYICKNGVSYHGVFLGPLKTFRGTWGTTSSDNRVYTSRTKTGDKIFFTWNDTHVDGEINNQHPDVFARGFDLISNDLTSVNGGDGPNIVTSLSNINQEAYWQCTSPIVFSDNNKYTIPVCTQWFTTPTGETQFKYISDFSFKDSDFTITTPVYSWLCDIGIEQHTSEIDPVTVYPNPVEDIVKISLILTHNAFVSVDITNLIGKRLISLNKGTMNAGSQQISIDASNLSAGIYFVTVRLNGQIFTRKLIVE
ncbi:MAG: T9SS type A sorting domain-containing protein [Bacteroidales bacterium]|nr:T9SS type A sorting domain-containing protein [Bacteroidales bacterium]